MLVLFAAAMLVSGTLLFLVQPMFARMVLPLLGGSPAVWNTAMLFYQVVLLAGYLYAHGAVRWLSPRQQRVLHIGVLLLPAIALPIGVPAGWTPPGGANPVPWLMATLLLGAGLPFFVVSTSTPLLQAWFARTSHSSAANPYALYAASNAGSMLALIAYPFLIEPRLSLRMQSLGWSAGYAALILLIGCAALLSCRAPGSSPSAEPRRDVVMVRRPLAFTRRLRWVLLAFIPSSLMLSVTMYMSTNIAPFPLLWVVPLAIYLLTFVVAFGSRNIVARIGARRGLPWLLLPLLVSMLADTVQPMRVLIGLHLLAFTLVALICHDALAQDAPETASLTEFYLWLSVGGALGGVFNALLAPLMFSSVMEYPLVLMLAALVIRIVPDGVDAACETGPGSRLRDALTSTRFVDVAAPLALVPLVPLLHRAAQELDIGSGATMRVQSLVIPALICFTFAERRLRFALGLAALIAGSVSFERDRHVLLTERSFFGVSRVMTTASGKFHALSHGSISHGAQSLDPARRREPLTYYTRSGPAGLLIAARQALGPTPQVAVVGLGTGSLACYRRDGERWTFFEIDPAVLRIATDPKYFTFLRDCTPDTRVVLGDARLSLMKAADHAFDMILLDAYSADAIPVHLMTREALALYRRKLAPGGIIAVHISNLFFDLEPVVGALAADAGMFTLVSGERSLTYEEARLGKVTSEWMVLAGTLEDLKALRLSATWRPVRTASPIWTDDFASTLGALR